MFERLVQARTIDVAAIALERSPSLTRMGNWLQMATASREQ
jgi:hypothetical protein